MPQHNFGVKDAKTIQYICMDASERAFLLDFKVSNIGVRFSVPVPKELHFVMDWLETRVRNDSGQPNGPYGPRSQGQTDMYYDHELKEALELPSLHTTSEFVPEDRVAPVIFALQGILHPEVNFYVDEVRQSKFQDYLVEFREEYKALKSIGKRPWPVFMQAALDDLLTAADCDAIYALTKVFVVGKSPAGKLEIGFSVAGVPFDTKVLFDGKQQALAELLPEVSEAVLTETTTFPVVKEAGARVAAKTRVHGAGGYRNMTKNECISEIARRTTELVAYRAKVQV